MNPLITEITALIDKYHRRSESISRNDARITKPIARRISSGRRKIGTLDYLRGRNHDDDNLWRRSLDLRVEQIVLLREYHRRLIVHDGDLDSFMREYGVKVVGPEDDTKGFYVVRGRLPIHASDIQRTEYIKLAEICMENRLIAIANAKPVDTIKVPLEIKENVYFGDGVRLG